jgi:putative transposase
LPVRRTLVKLGIPRATFYRWYDLYRTGGPDALGDRSPRPDRVWNQIPDMVRQRIIRLALDEPALSPRELAVRFTDTERYFARPPRHQLPCPRPRLLQRSLGWRPGGRISPP